MAKEGLGLEITELRLGLPGGGASGIEKSDKKRVFSDIEASDWKDDRCKNQVMGWPPVCSYRRKNSCVDASKGYVKVSMDGAPFLRKIDLSNHKAYDGLTVAFEKLFGCYGIGEMLKDGDGSEYLPIYEDKDGDWMLVGDVPWEMFVESCKRLRIMKKSDAKGFGLNLRASFVKGSLDEK